LRRQAAGCRVAGADARTGAAAAGVRARRAHHDAVAAALERGCLLEARLQQHRADEPGRTGAAPRRVRQAERNRARQPRGVIPPVSPCGRRWREAPDEGFSPQMQTPHAETDPSSVSPPLRGVDPPSPARGEGENQEDVLLTRPFEGVKILDFTQVLAGPYASYQLALLGADVIKIERRGGEDMRRTPLSREWADRNLAPAFLAVNGNKRSLTLDLAKPDAIAIVKQLAAQADVVMENFRPGVMDKLGIGYAGLSAINPRLVYCAISGFGQTGPERNGAGYDGKIQAMSGIMAITGHEASGPTRAGFAVCDVLSGSTAAFGVSSALFQRTHTGKGQMIDVSMLEASLAFLSGQVADYSVAGHRQQLSGNQAVSRKATANLFKAGEGHLLLAVNNES